MGYATPEVIGSVAETDPRGGTKGPTNSDPQGRDFRMKTIIRVGLVLSIVACSAVSNGQDEGRLASPPGLPPSRRSFKDGAVLVIHGRSVNRLLSVRLDEFNARLPVSERWGYGKAWHAWEVTPEGVSPLAIEATREGHVIRLDRFNGMSTIIVSDDASEVDCLRREFIHSRVERKRF
jgi:hypothetical protein